jgi:hypothetical protein
VRDFWISHRGAIITFGAICASVAVLPNLVIAMAEHYAAVPVVIPVWVRTFMMMGAFVRRLGLPIIFTAAIVLFGISLARTHDRR